MPDEKWDEAVKAVVQPKSGVDIDAVELVDLVKLKLGSVDFMTGLPRSTNGKVLKVALRKLYWDAQSRNIG